MTTHSVYKEEKPMHVKIEAQLMNLGVNESRFSAEMARHPHPFSFLCAHVQRIN